MKIRPIFTLESEQMETTYVNIGETTNSSTESFGVLECLHELNDSVTETTQDNLYSIYTASIESSRDSKVRDRIVTEGFKDFLKSSGNIITKFINKVKEIFERIHMWVTSRLGSFEKFIKKNRDRLTRFSGTFETNLIEFDINSDIPNLSVISELINQYNLELANLSDYHVDHFKKRIIDTNLEEKLDRIRGSVLGKENVSSTDFPDEITDAYRNGNSRGTDVQIGSSQVALIIEGYSKLVSYRKSFNKERTRVMKYLSDLKNFFERGSSIAKTGGSLVHRARFIDSNPDKFQLDEEFYETSADTSTKMSLFFSTKLSETKDLSSIVLLALNGKANAIRDNIIQFERIIRQAASMHGKDEK